MPQESVYYIDGEYVAAGQATLPATDLATLRGYGVFDFTRTYNGLPFQLGAHLRRLQTSAALIDLRCPWDIETLSEIVMETLRRNSFAEAGISLFITGGDSPNNFMPSGASRLLVLVNPLHGLPATVYARGGAVVTVAQQRDLPQAKTINYIPGIRAQMQAQQRNPAAIDAIYCADGKVLEGTRSNTFIFSDGRWITPAQGVLLGITRAQVIKLLAADGRLELRDISLEEYYAAEEIIITSSTKEIVPIVMVDDMTIGAGGVGENSKRLMRQWRAMTAAYVAAGVVL